MTRPPSVLLLLALSLPACAPSGAEPEAPAAPKASAPRRVHVHELVPTRAEERLPSTSHLESWRQVEVVARVQAQVVEVHAVEGESVDEGQLLVQLDDRQPRLEVDAAAARVAEIEDLRREAEVALDEAQQRLELAQKDLEKSRNDVERSRRSAEEEIVSTKQLEDDELAFARAQNQLELQKIAVAKARIGIEKLATEKRSAEIQREIKERVLDDYTIEAPFAGIIARSICKGGEWTTPQATLLEMTSKGRLVVYFARPQQELGRIRVGQLVELTVDAYPGEVFAGRLAFVAPVVDRQTGTFRARAEIEDPEQRLRAGMFTRAEIVTEVSAEALLVPRTGIFYDGAAPFAYVVREDRAMRLPITPGISTKNAIEARNQSAAGSEREFRPGDLVVVVGGEDLEAGQAVEITGRRDADGRLLAREDNAANATGTDASARRDG